METPTIINIQLVELVTFADDIDSLSMRVTDFLLNDSYKKNGFFEKTRGFCLYINEQPSINPLVRLNKPIRLIRSLPFTNVNRMDQWRNTAMRNGSFNSLRQERGNSILMDGLLCQRITHKLFLAISRSETYRANKTNFSIFFVFVFPI